MKKYYLTDSEIGCDEDGEHEFKSHRTISYEEIPTWAVYEENNKVKKSRQPVSKTICSLLNTGKGGICYLGVSNDGKVKGLKMTQYQKDHILVSIQDTLSRFNPVVTSEQVKVVFVPVFDESFVKSENFETNFEKMQKEFEDKDDPRSNHPHSLRNCNYCWCDKESLKYYNSGIIPPNFVVEIIVKPWDGVSETKTPLYPIYQCETGLAFMRRQASNVQISVQDVFSMTKTMVHNYYAPEIRKLEEELESLRVEAEKNLKVRSEEESKQKSKVRLDDE